MTKSRSMNFARIRGGFTSLSKEKQNELFYLSLFDPASWEEGEDLFNEKEIKNSIIKILKGKEFSNQFKDWSFDDFKRFVTSNFFTDNASNNILSYSIQTGGFRVKPEEGKERIDIKVIRKGDEVGCIELKRLIATNNIKEEIERFHEKIKSCPKKKDSCKHMFLCLFPVTEREDTKRVKRLIIGYQSLVPQCMSRSINLLASYFLPVNSSGKTDHRFVLDHVEELIKEAFKA
jgi:hypothetical protein